MYGDMMEPRVRFNQLTTRMERIEHGLEWLDSEH